MAEKPGTSLLSGSVTVVTAQTPVQLTTVEPKGTCSGVFVSGDFGNVGKNMTVGPSAAGTVGKTKEVKGLVIHEFNGPTFIEIDDPTKLWVDAEVSGDKLAFLAVIL
jgi:hypothetical protein